MSERKRRKRGLPPVGMAYSPAQLAAQMRAKNRREARAAQEREATEWRAMRAAGDAPQNLDALTIPDCPQADFIGIPNIDDGGHQATNSREPHIAREGQVSTMREPFVDHLTDAVRGSLPPQPRRMTEDDARLFLEERDFVLAQALNCCHYGAMPQRELAHREGVTQQLISYRLRKAKYLVERWCGHPVTAGPDSITRTIVAVTSKWLVDE